MTTARQTTDHQDIRKWTEARSGRPAKVKGASRGGILRIDFREPDENLEEISWQEFFDIFDSAKLAFLYQDETEGGKESRFNKFVDRE
ncbi:hypothetical protein [Ciceribacter thiooxidans]|uniref:1,4-alpha-glucan branching enzyme n=1 Tax=Ciceribacter thiooxidans TaxID=1969821 RepID=A0ABV7I111_9HYPH|nr:hypothetical protein [Ciceribacter thiooxidans]MDI6838768.1 hypothetical protein [Rhizobiaceae bacterium]